MAERELKGAVDIGSNTVQMLVGEIKNKKVKPCLRYLATTRLGKTPGFLSESAIKETLKALTEINSLLNRVKISGMRLIGTSALRDAKNSSRLLDAVREKFNWEIEIINGLEEARLSYLGAASILGPGEYIVLDIGGGSTEIITENGGPASKSYNLGAVRAYKNSWGRKQIKEQLLIQGALPSLKGKTLIGVGGTITTAAAFKKGLKKYNSRKVQGTILSLEEVTALGEELAGLSLAARCQYSPLLARRGEIILEGLAILESAMDLLGAKEIIVSDAGILEGLLLAEDYF